MLRAFKGLVPRVHASAYVNELAYVVGDVGIGAFSSVWPGVVIRADRQRISIGQRTNIQDNSVIHTNRGYPLTIGDEVMIGHGVIVHCTRVGNHVLIGNNATLLDEVEVDEFCIIAAGAVVPPRMKVPRGSFVVGVPGQVRGPLTEPQWARLLHQGEGYVQLAREYREAGL
ncbi:MAG: gamma carbonic anhydrase family protein [Dehalococcoidia bacterium]|nr:gamma carbonic anhydrase family protein [Dehalococcoidia bacterium]